MRCDETITYTTHCDFTFLNNVVPVLERFVSDYNLQTIDKTLIITIYRWSAPLSVAVYAPGDDYEATISIILFLRNCHPQSQLVRQFATFHIFFESQFLPKNLRRNFNETEKYFICPTSEPFHNFPHEKTFKATHNLTYPVNVGRNLAREAALTHFILASDIELYPNPGFVENFFDMMLKDSDKVLEGKK